MYIYIHTLYLGTSPINLEVPSAFFASGTSVPSIRGLGKNGGSETKITNSIKKRKKTTEIQVDGSEIL